MTIEWFHFTGIFFSIQDLVVGPYSAVKKPLIIQLNEQAQQRTDLKEPYIRFLEHIFPVNF